MYKNFQYLLFGAMMFMLMASTCEEPVSLDIDPEDAKLVLISEITTGEPAKLQVSKSWSVLSPRPIGNEKYPSNVTAQLWQGSTKITEFLIGNHSDEQIFQSNFIPQIGTNYTIKVDAPGFEMVEATTSIPEPREIRSFDVLSSRKQLLPSGRYVLRHIYEVELEVDLLFENDFYYISFSYLTENQNSRRTHSFHLEDTGFNPRYLKYTSDDDKEWILIRGSDLNGPLKLSFILSGETTSATESLKELYTEVKSVSKDFYEAYNSAIRQKQQSASDSIFMEPVLLFTNVENGYGYFAGYSTTRDTLLAN